MSNISSIMGLVGLLIMCMGILVFVFGVIGLYKYSFILNRMHTAGMGDTLGLFLCLLGLCFISGVNFTTAKLVLIILFMWLTSPTSSHLISGMEALTDDDISNNAKIEVEDLKSYVDGHVEKENKE